MRALSEREKAAWEIRSGLEIAKRRLQHYEDGVVEPVTAKWCNRLTRLALRSCSAE